MKHKRFWWGLLGIILSVLLFLPLVIGIYAAEGGGIDGGPGTNDIPTLFYNDTAWVMDRYYPALGFLTGSMYDFWIPLSFFEELDGIKVRRGPGRNVTSFVISDTTSGKYLSFNTTVNEYAQTERGTHIFIRTTLFSKERYLPMRDMCLYFGWTFEISENRASVRILDGHETKTFEELLEQYQPQETQLTKETTAPPEHTTVPPDTEEPPVYSQIYRSDTVYLTFEDIDTQNTPDILDVLSLYDTKATFFVTGEQLLADTDLVIRILAEGHALGLHTMSADEYALKDTEAILASLAEENDLLYALTKRKTRLARLPEGTHSSRLYLRERQKTQIADAGYVLWDWNIESMDRNEAYSIDMILEKIDNALKISYNPVIRFHNTARTAEAVGLLLGRIEEVQTITAMKITEATENVLFP